MKEISRIMKYLISAALMCFAISSNAAFTSCGYEDAACDQFGNHFHCYIIGWTGMNPPEYCSPGDQSSGPGKSKKVLVPSTDNSSQSSAESSEDDSDRGCLTECGRRCLEKPIFCGRW